MMKTVNAGNLVIGRGMPKIAVPVMAADEAEARAQGETIMNSPADLLELRADHVADCRDAAAVLSVLSALKETVPNRPVLFTVRTAAEGGEADLTDEEYSAICREAMDSGMADLIDLEYALVRGRGSEESSAASLPAYARERGLPFIFSAHDFHGTPSSAEITEKMMKMAADGADIVKMAVMPRTDEDVIEVLQASVQLKKKQDVLGVPFILISMSEKGLVSRLSGECFGSAVTFARAGSASAPGQIDADDLDRVLRIIHRHSIKEETGTLSGKTHNNNGAGNISLIGFMGTGKTTVSRELSRLTGMEAVELDDLLVEEAGMSIPDIFAKYGEGYFRELEERICAKASSGPPSVISCGGGTPMRKANVDCLKEAGVIILLEASPETVYDRVSRTEGDRPMLAGHMTRGYISWLMKQREEAYRRAADEVVRIDGKTASEVAEEILFLSKKHFLVENLQKG